MIVCIRIAKHKKIDSSDFILLNKFKTSIVTILKKKSIRDLEDKNREPLLEDDNIKQINFINSDEMKAVIRYKDGRWEIIDLADYNRGIVFTELRPEQLLFVFLPTFLI